MKQRIRLTESGLHRIVKESVKKILREMDTPKSSEEQLAWSENDFSDYRDKENLDWMMNRDEQDAEQGRPSPFNRNIYPSNKSRREVRNQSNRPPYKWKNESLNRIIKESLRKVLNEGGHIYFKDEDGNIHTNSKETWLGVPGTTFIWHGSWSDPEIIYKGRSFNPDDVEEGIAYAYEDEGVLDMWHNDYDAFCDWVKNNPNAALDELDNCVFGQTEAEQY